MGAVKALRPVLPALLLLGGLAATFPGVFFGGRTLAALPGSPGLTHRAGVPDSDGARPPLGAAVTPGLDTSAAFVDEPLLRVASAQIKEGRFPLWNPHAAMGTPLFAAFQAAPLSPLRWPLLAWPDVPWMWDAVYLGRFLLAGLLAWGWLRNRGLGAPAALAGAFSFMLTGYFVLHASMHNLGSEIWLPGMLWACDAHGRSGRRGSLAALAGLGWLSATGGNPESCVIAAGSAALWTLFHVRAWGAGRVLRMVTALGLGCLAAGPVWTMGFEYLAVSAHHHPASTGTDAFRPWALAELLLPGLYRSADNPHHILSVLPPTLGLVVLSLAKAATLGPRGQRLRKDAHLPVTGLGIFLLACLAKMFGLPGVQWIGRLPLLDLFIWTKYLFVPAALAAAALAAAGTQRLVDGDRVPLWPVAALLGTGLLLAWWGEAQAEARGLGWVPSRSALLPPLLASMAGILIAFRGPAARRGGAAAVAVALSLALAAPHRYPLRVDPLPPFPPVTAVASMQGQPATGRVFGAFGAVAPNLAGVYGLHDIRIHEALMVGRTARALSLLNPNFTPSIFDGNDLGERTREERIAAWAVADWLIDKPYFKEQAARENHAFNWDHPLLDLFAVRWILVPARSQAEALLELLPDRYAPVAFTSGGPVLENQRALPRAFVVHQTVHAADEDEAAAALAELVSGRDDALRIRAVVEGADAPRLDLDAPLIPSRASIVHEDPVSVVVEVHAEAQGLLVLSDTFYRGWEASLAPLAGGEAVGVPVFPTDLMLRGVKVPAGSWTVAFRYRPATWTIGWVLAAAAAMMLCTILFGVRAGR